MAHPYASHKADKVAKSAAKARVSGYASGGKVSHSRDAAPPPQGAGVSSRGQKSPMIKSPGGHFTGGAEGGLGRLQKARDAKRMRG